MNAATVSVNCKVVFNGLTPGEHLEFSWHLTPVTGPGISGSLNVETEDVTPHGQLVFNQPLHKLCKGNAGQLHVWARNAGSGQSAPPVVGAFGAAEVTVQVP